MLAPAEASANLARFDGVRYGHRADGVTDLLSMYEETRAQGFGDEVKRRIMLGTYALSSGYYDAYYGSAQRVRTKIVEDFQRRFRAGGPGGHADLADRGLRLGELADDPLAMYLSDYCTVPDVAGGHPRHLDPRRASPRGCPWASSWPARRSARTGSWTPPTRWSGASASRRCPSADARHSMTELEPVIGLEIHVQLQTQDQDVLRLRAVVRRGAQHAHLPGLPRACPARCR